MLALGIVTGGEIMMLHMPDRKGRTWVLAALSFGRKGAGRAVGVDKGDSLI
jgi:hypothetical protein